MIADAPAIRVLRDEAQRATEEWAREISLSTGVGIDPTYAKARAGYILDLIDAITRLRSK
jgi:hypothetical protein